MTGASRARIGLLTTIPTPYRLPLFTHLSERSDITLHVAFNARSERNRHWQLSEPYAFDYTILPGRTISIGLRDLIACHINWGIKRWLTTHQFDAVIIGGWSWFAQQAAMLMCRRLDIATILWSGSTIGEAGAGRLLSQPLVRAIVHRSDAFVSYGTASTNYLEALGAHPDRIVTGCNTVDVDWWAKEAATAHRHALRRRLELMDHQVVLYSGQLIHRKGVDLLLKAIQILQKERRRITLLIAGSGPLESTLREQSSTLEPGTVRFLGHIDPRDLAQHYAIADVVVLPSRSEVWGLSLNEAMASSCAVIASDICGAAPDLIDHGRTGWVFQTGDSRSLTAYLRECLALSDQERATMGRHAQHVMRSTFSIERSADAFLSAVSLALDRELRIASAR